MRTSLVILCALVGLASCAVFQSTIHRRETLQGRLKRLGKWKQYVDLLTALGLRSSDSNGTYVHHVNDFGDFMYATNITIGTPPQQFAVDLDTGSPDSWVPDSTCSSVASTMHFVCAYASKDLCPHICPSAVCDGSRHLLDENDCYGHKLFNSSASSTYKDGKGKWSIGYGEGYAQGIDGIDTIRLGDNFDLSVKDYHFGQAQLVSPDFGQYFHADGLFGLSPGRAGEGDKKTVIEAAAAQGLLDKPVFTVWLEEKGSADNVPAGVFTYGGVDTKNCGPVIDYRPVTKGQDPRTGKTDYVWWKFDLEGVSFGNWSASGKFDATSDTGTTFLYGNADHVKAIRKAIGAKKDPERGYVVDCDTTFAPIVFTIGGKKYPVDHKQLILHDDPNDAKNCVLALGEGGDWLLGDPWVRQYCQVHDIAEKKIGFAKANP